MGNLLVILIIALLIGLAGHKVYKDRKNGNMCAGCAMGKQCSQKHKKGNNEFIIK